MTIKAIETSYKGYLFRSRLEARWGVFFDAMKVRWEYESEGYAAGAEAYLPDFRLGSFTQLVVRRDASAERITKYSIQPDPSQVTRWDDDLDIINTRRATASFVEIKPLAMVESDARKCCAFAKESGDQLIVATGDPYDMNLLLMGFNPPEGFYAGRAVIAGSANGALSLLVQGAGCTTEDFILVASQFRGDVMPAAVAARSARFEHGECG